MSAQPSRSHALRAYIDKVYAEGVLVGDDGVPRPIRPTGIAPEVGEALRGVARSAGALHTVEVGLAFGLSTLFIAEALLQAGDLAAHHYAVDPLQELLFGNAGLRSIKAAGIDDLVTHIDLSSDIALPRLLEERRGQFDLAFVDGAHWFDYAFVDTFFCIQLVKPGGLVILDDTWMPGPQLVVRYMVTNLGCTEVTDGRFPQTTRRGRFGRTELTWPHLTILRTPTHGADRAPDQFVPFTRPETVRDGAFQLAGVAKRRLRRAR